MTRTVTWSPERPVLHCAYNLFCDPQRPALFCAVPEDRPVPGFLDRWEFARSVRVLAEFPPGFREKAARLGVRYSGFYLFQTTAETGGRKTLIIRDPVDNSSAHHALKLSAICFNDNGVPFAGVG
jgi:DNA-binding transcriptional MerR regulator